MEDAKFLRDFALSNLSIVMANCFLPRLAYALPARHERFAVLQDPVRKMGPSILSRYLSRECIGFIHNSCWRCRDDGGPT
jgi:hypothetical protein